MVAPRGGTRQCPRCGAGVPPGALTCPADGTSLELPFEPTAPLPLGGHVERTVVDAVSPLPAREPGDGEEIATVMNLPTLDDLAETLPPRRRPDLAATPHVGSPAFEPGSGGRSGASSGPEADPRSPPFLDRTLVRPTGSFVFPGLDEVVPTAPAEVAPDLRKPPPDPGDEEISASRKPRADPVLGSRIGEYVVEEKIGAGGMGIVYRGIQPLIGKPVAIKVLKPEIAGQPEQMKRLLDEARAVNAIRHRNIIDIFSFGQLPDGRHYVVMEYLDGEGLDAYLKRKAPLPLAEALSLLEEVLSTLSAAHAAGVIHRDLKPSNIFLITPPRGARYIKLLDFGLAKQGALPGGSTPQTRFAVIVGTPDYMSPEQARGEAVGPFTDLYSLGVMAYQMLTGQLPFTAATPMLVLIEHQERPAPKASSVNPLVPAALDNLLLRLMAKSPLARPSSADEVLEGLRRVGTAQARPPPEPPQPAEVTKTAKGEETRPLRRPSAPSTPAPRVAIEAVDTTPSRAAPKPSRRAGAVPDMAALAMKTDPQRTAPRSGTGAAWLLLALVAVLALAAVIALLILRPPWRKVPQPLPEGDAHSEPAEPAGTEPPPAAGTAGTKAAMPAPAKAPPATPAKPPGGDRPRPQPHSKLAELSAEALVARIERHEAGLASGAIGSSAKAVTQLVDVKFDAQQALRGRDEAARKRTARKLASWERQFLK